MAGSPVTEGTNNMTDSDNLKNQLATAHAQIAEMQNKINELEALAVTDPVTNLMNRRGFEKLFAQEQARMRRHDVPGSVLLLFDLDKFKEINDTHGHLAGDACLKKIGDFLRGRLRTLDGAARIGGDEFAVLLSHTDPEKAAVAISEMKAILSDMDATWQDKKLHFSASVGVEYITAEGTYESACHAADLSLYTSKKAKR